MVRGWGWEGDGEMMRWGTGWWYWDSNRRVNCMNISDNDVDASHDSHQQ